MKDIPDNHFDLGIVDIPYGINRGGGKMGGDVLAINKDYKDYGDTETMPIEYHIELKRVCKNRILWGANHFISNIPFNSPCWIVWDKQNGENNFADCELAWASFNTAVRIFRFQWRGMIQGYGGNKSKNETRIHPNQKPVALYKWLLKNYANPGDKLLDTHSGSGSFRIAAHDLGFDLVSCELDPDYCRDNEARYQKHIQQIDLFKPEEIQENVYKNKELFDG